MPLSLESEADVKSPCSPPARQLRGLALLLVIAAAMLLGACGSKPPMRWVALPLPTAAPTAGPAVSTFGTGAGSSSTPVLTVRRIDVPEYLQSSSVRYRERDSVLAEWPDVRWADRVEVGLTEHLLMRLRQRLPGWMVCDRQCPASSDALTAHVALAPLDYVRPARELQAQARWQLSWRDRSAPAGAADRHLPMMQHSQQAMRAFALPVSRDDAEGQAQAMGRLLDELAAEMAATILAARPTVSRGEASP